MTPAIELSQVRKSFGDVVALKSVSFDIADKAFFTLLGPSGCGKTTLLRMIAGFETPSSGEIHVHGKEMAALPPHKRPVNTVFQNYALFPHLTVERNVGFALERLGWTRRDVAMRVGEMLERVQLQTMAQRRPAQLSGGQQQRVALARAMAPRPKVLLLDEPLSALDLKLRQAMRSELKTLQEETGITFVFVTHDQEEALTMSDRIAVMSAGEVQQIGAPEEIYDAPRNRFVAEFVGESNLLPVEVESVDSGRVTARLSSGQVIQSRYPRDTPPKQGQKGWVSVRPERLFLRPPGERTIDGYLFKKIYVGADTLHLLRMEDGFELKVRETAGPHRVEIGNVFGAELPRFDAMMFVAG